MKKKLLGTVATLALIATSCSTPKNITYFPELQNGSTLQADHINSIKVRPEDKLSIVVSAQDPSLASLFNLVTPSNRTGASLSSGTIGNPSSNSSNQVSYYTVDPQGDIEFPVIGKINIAGLTRFQVAHKITDELTSRNLIKNPIVTVEFVNTRIAVLGEVSSPGLYTFNEDHLTLLDAIAAAGDLSINGLRENILVIRSLDEGKQEAYRVNMLNAQQLVSSPAYYLQADDVIYVEPNDKVKRETTPNGNSPYTPFFWISLGSTALTLVTLILTLTR